MAISADLKPRSPEQLVCNRVRSPRSIIPRHHQQWARSPRHCHAPAGKTQDDEGRPPRRALRTASAAAGRRPPRDRLTGIFPNSFHRLYLARIAIERILALRRRATLRITILAARIGALYDGSV